MVGLLRGVKLWVDAKPPKNRSRHVKPPDRREAKNKNQVRQLSWRLRGVGVAKLSRE